MIDMRDLRRAIEIAPPGVRAAVVTKDWLEQVERELVTGNADLAELAAIRAERAAQA
jgi:hypothetical protein